MKSPIYFKKFFYLFLMILTAVILNWNNVSAQSYTRETKFLSRYPAAQNEFGCSVDISGTYAIVGEDRGDYPAQEGGSVNILKYDGYDWEIQETLLPSDVASGDHFGYSVAIDGNIAVVGAFGDDGEPSDSAWDQGAIYIFHNNGIHWEQEAKLYYSDPQDQDFLGYSVDICGDFIIVGAPQVELPTKNKSQNLIEKVEYTGYAVVFKYDGQQWSEYGTLTSTDPNAAYLSRFGESVGIDSNKIVIGAPASNYNAYYSGASFIYEFDGNNWIEKSALIPGDVQERDQLGTEVVVQNDFIMVGSNFMSEGDGFVYCFKNNGTTWQEIQKLDADDPIYGTYFGGSLKIDGNLMVVSRQGDDDKGSIAGAVYVYEYNGEEWIKKIKIVASDAAEYDEFGTAVSISGKTVIVGSPLDDDNQSESGSVYIYELILPPASVRASNGLNNRVRLDWSAWSNPPENYKIFRDNEEIATLSSATNSFSDYNTVPGKLHKYGVASYNSMWSVSHQIPAYGWSRPKGRIDGRIHTQMNAGIDDVEISAFPSTSGLHGVLQFDGNDDYVLVEDNEKLNPINTMTLEVIVKSNVFNRNTPQQFVAKGGDPPNTSQPRQFGFQPEINTGIPHFYFYDTSNQPHDIGASEILTSGQWYHLAATYNGQDLKIYIDGELKGIKSVGSFTIQKSTDPLAIGRLGSQNTHYFNGLISEVRLWNLARTDSAINTDKSRILHGDENGLVGYWRFQEDMGMVAGDFAVGGGNHGIIYGATWKENDKPDVKYRTRTDNNGDYSLRDIYFGEQANFNMTPYKEQHAFDPASRSRTLDINTPIISDLTFIDTTAFTVSGNIYQNFHGSMCYVQDVELLVNGLYKGIKTDAAGNFALTIEEPGTYTIVPRYAQHTFSPAQISLNVNEDRSGLLIEDVTTHTLSGSLRGGSTIPIGDLGLRIFTENYCIDTTVITNPGANGNFNINLPTQKYYLQVTGFIPYNSTLFPDPTLVINYFSIDSVDLISQDAIKNFVFHLPPQIFIAGYPQHGCNLYVVPIMEQGRSYEITINVIEDYLTDTCFVDSGSVIIVDNIAEGNKRDTLVIKNGFAHYRIEAGFPNIISPHFKSIEFYASAGNQDGFNIDSVLVTGNAPRTATFTTVSPEIPMMILRDPPGDASYSYLSEQTTFSQSIGFQVAKSKASNIWGEVKIGFQVSVGVGMFISFSSDTRIWGLIRGSLEVGTTQKSLEEFELSLTSSQLFSTSGNQNITGEEGDVFIGAAINLLYALTDVIAYDSINCRVVRDTTIIFSPKGLKTTFMYTENHIRNVLIPQLERFRDFYISHNNPDSARLYINQIKVWEQTLVKNRDLKQSATFVENRSFSAGAQFESSQSTSLTHIITTEFEIEIENSVAREVGFEIAGSGISGGSIVTTRYQTGVSQSKTITQNNMVGYVLNDDDIGDYFSVNVKADPVYGTPVFDLVAGTSSCPHEPGTQPRDSLEIAINQTIQDNVSPDQTANFVLYLRNLSQSNETRTYHLSVIQSNNYDGAIIRVGGVVIEDYLSYTVPAFQEITATLTVERGPIAYDYEDLQLKFYSPCDETTIADTIACSVHFISPCSQVELYRPVDNWIVNQASHDSLQVIFRDYNINNENLLDLSFEYRKLGEAWQTAFTIPRTVLPPLYYEKYWDVSQLSNGDFELRAAANCGLTGLNYSAVVPGKIDRNKLMVFGTPEPVDGMLNLGEEISISFTAMLNCERIASVGQVTLISLDDSSQLAINVQCSDDRLILSPLLPLANYEGYLLKATVANIYDISGNQLPQPVSWTFLVNQNPLYWIHSNVQKSLYTGIQDRVSGELFNAGGETESFTISEYRYWLTPDLTSGQIPGNGHQPINFTISDQLNPGIYNDTVYAITAKGDEPFYITVNVLTKPPEWTVTPANYQYSMTITAEVSIDNDIANNEFDRVSAMVGNEVRGVANLQFVQQIDGYLAFLTVYSNTSNGETINFRFWDALKEKEYGNVTESVVFQSNGITGSVLNPITLHPQGIAQTIKVNQGWTWISINIESDDLSIENILNNIDKQNGNFIKGQNLFSQFSQSTGWAGTLNRLKAGEAYMVKLANKGHLWLAGKPVDISQNPIPIQIGWNWIGYLPDSILPINTVLTSYAASSGDRIKSQNQFAEYDAISGNWIGDLEYMAPGEGYLLNSLAGGTLTYSNALPKNRRKEFNLTRSSYSTIDDFPACEINVNDYENTMSVIGVLKMNGSESKDSLDLIGAFVNTTCRGFAHPVYIPNLNRYEVFLMIYSNEVSGESINFLLYDKDKNRVQESENTITFSSNGIMGTIDQPLELRVLDTTAPKLTNAFHFSTEKSLARYIRLFIAADEPLLQTPRVTIINSYSNQTHATTLFSSEENIHVLDYYIEELGQAMYVVTAFDYSGNNTRDTLNLNVQTYQSNTSIPIVLNDQLILSPNQFTFKESGYLYTQQYSSDQEKYLHGRMKVISDIYEVQASTQLDGKIGLTYDLSDLDMTEEGMRKIRYYRYNENEDSWSALRSDLHQSKLSAEIDRLGKIALGYDEDYVPIPDKFMVYQNYPNPFNPETLIRFDLSEKEQVTLEIFGILGQKIKTVISQAMEPGYHHAVWNGSDEANQKVASGIYIYRLRAGKNEAHKKMILIR